MSLKSRLRALFATLVASIMTVGLIGLAAPAAQAADTVIPLPAQPSIVDDPQVCGDARYVVPPNDPPRYTWELQPSGAVYAGTLPGYIFQAPDGSLNRSWPYPAPIDKCPAPTSVDIPSAPSIVDDPAVQGDAHYTLPANTAQVTWTLNADGSATATTNSGFQFSDGTKSKTFAAPVDAYTAPTTPPTTTAPAPQPTQTTTAPKPAPKPTKTTTAPKPAPKPTKTTTAPKPAPKPSKATTPVRPSKVDTDDGALGGEVDPLLIGTGIALVAAATVGTLRRRRSA